MTTPCPETLAEIDQVASYLAYYGSSPASIEKFLELLAEPPPFIVAMLDGKPVRRPAERQVVVVRRFPDVFSGAVQQYRPQVNEGEMLVEMLGGEFHIVRTHLP